MTQANPESNQPDSSNEAARDRTAVDHVLERLALLDLPAKEHFEDYLRSQVAGEPQGENDRELLHVDHALSAVLWSIRQERHRATPTLRPRSLHRT